MNKFKIGIIGTIVVASAIGTVAIQRHATVHLREQNESLQHQADVAARLSAENERLSNLVATVKSSNSLSREQLTELLKLRNEVGQLRHTEAELSRLQADNAKLRAKAEQAAKQLAEAQTLPNYWPKEQLAFAGYGDPESALKSMLAAMKNGDVSSYQTMLTPEALADLQKELAKHGLSQEQQEKELRAMGTSLVSSSAGFHIVDETMPTPDQAVINLSFDGEGVERKFVLKQVQNQWKFQDLLVAGQQLPPPK
jgi:myosin heavy subunit